jgi:hypothetical protein
MRHIVKQYTWSLALILFLGARLVFSTTPAHGQVDISPGVRVGFNSASFGGDTEEFAQALAGSASGLEVDTGRRSGFLVGGFAVVDFGGSFSLQPGLRYIQRGYGVDLTVSVSGQESTTEGSLNLSYLDIPILARFEFSSGGVAPHVFAGPNIGFNLNAESEFDDETEDISDSVSGTDFGLEFGAGVDFGLSAGTLTADVRYGLGLTDVPDEGDLSLSNRALMITAGFSF